MKITIDPRLKFNYASWYLEGIRRCYGMNVVTYDVQPFREIRFTDVHDLNAGMALIVQNAEKTLKVFIDYEDVSKIFIDRYKWCDVYAMVNPKKEHLEMYPKVVAIGPEFGITLNSTVITVATCLLNYYKGRKYNELPLKLYLRDYLYTILRRRKLSCYEVAISPKDNYIFHASTLWYNEFAWTNTNRYRG